MPSAMSQDTAGLRKPHSGRNLHGQIIDSLRAMVLNGALVEGKRIPEAKLCDQFGISRTPLREALKVLASEGFIELRHNRGAVVAPVDPRNVAEQFELNGAMERLIGQTIPARITPEDLDAIEDVYRRLGDAMDRDQPDSYTKLNHDFHQSLAAATHNETLVRAYSSLQQKLLRARFAINVEPGQLRRSMSEHSRIMAMLRAGAARDLAYQLEEHNRLTAEAILQQFAARP